ncbi:hypothetical protein QZH41_008995, partial [Actinostola sp. cb2023]
SSPSGLYYFKNVSDMSTPYQAHCAMDVIDGCGGKGWSLVMKIDGHKTTFHYNSTYWTDKRTYNPSAGKTGFDTMETKLPFYWSTPFTHLCLGMKIGHVTRWLKVVYSGNSLYDVISGGKFDQFPNKVSEWRSLVPGSSLQHYYRIGFNNKASVDSRALINSRARVGIVANNENDYTTPDSRIGFGTGGHGRDEDDTNSCGNEAATGVGSDQGRVSIKAFCYILIQ